MAVVRLALLALFAAPLVAFAQPAHPTKPIRLVVPYPPGGSTDPLGRTLAQKSAEGLGQPIVLDAAGLPVLGTSAEELGAMVKRDLETFRRITAAAGIKPE
jgi:hypothetical protein